MPLNNSILKTKFFLPQPTSDFVERKSLVTKFESLKTRPLMLVSASTGYGKSTVVSAFLVNQKEDYAWLSLGEKENEFTLFVTYFIKAIQIKVPKFGNDVLDFLVAPQLPPIDDLAELLANDIAELDHLLYLALDDYHLVINKDIHQFIAKLFEYPQPWFRLIIISRRDPGLPFAEWITKNKIVEIRSADLKFNKDEIIEFYRKTISYKPDEHVLSKLWEITDGWISGLRMLSLSYKDTDDLTQQVSNFKYKNSRVIIQLVKAVIKNLSNATRNKLLSLSLLKEFNIELFTDLCLTQDERENNEVLFNEFISTITRSNMFIIALDDKHNWYRFHHMFIEQIQEILVEEYEVTRVNELRLLAADWYFRNNLHEEAIQFYLQANQVTKALNLFTEYRLQLIAETRFEYLEKIFNLFPQELSDKNSTLLVTKGWLLLQKGNIPEMAICIEPLEQLVVQEGHPRELQDLLIGEIHAMQAFDRYLSNVDMQACLEHSKKAIQLLKDQNPYALGIAWVYYAAALQHLGKPMKARKDLYNELEICSSDILRGQILLILCFLDWFEGDLTAMQKTAQHLLELGTNSGIKYLIASGNILSGIPYYHQNRDETALAFLEAAFELRHFAVQHMSFPAGMALADMYIKSGKEAEADSIIMTFEKTALEQSGKLFIKMTKSAASELAWRYNDDLSALRWATENDFKDFLPMANLYSPELVQASILVRDSDSASQNLAQEIINNTIPFFEDRNDTNILIRSFIIQALIFYKAGVSDKAFEILQKALGLSSFGHFIRPYLNLGDSMKLLLQKCKEITKNNTHIDEILGHFKEGAKSTEQVVLTLREKEVLILGEKMTNKEVGNQLFISEKTVKGHITNINKKLKVNSKLEAIGRAKELTLI